MKNKSFTMINYQTVFILETSLAKETVVSYYLSEDSQVEIAIYKATGKRELKKIINEKQGQGEYKININTENLPYGMYYIKRITKKIESTEKVDRKPYVRSNPRVSKQKSSSQIES